MASPEDRGAAATASEVIVALDALRTEMKPEMER
jgi:hypothetical protein